MDIVSQLEHVEQALLSSVTTEFPDALTDTEKTATHAYLVLSHAVLEEHLEDIFEAHFRRLLDWLSEDFVPIDVARLTFSVAEWLPRKIDVTYKKRSVPGTIGSPAVLEEFRRQVRNNHGLSPDNVLDLSKLIGLDWGQFENALNSELADLKNLSSKRGEASHLSPFTARAVKLSRQDYPDNVKEWVTLGRDAITSIGAYLDGLLAKPQHSPQPVDGSRT
jgi:hypothetical protein